MLIRCPEVRTSTFWLLEGGKVILIVEIEIVGLAAETIPHDCSGGAAGSRCMPEGRPATVLLRTDGAARLSGLNLTHLGARRHSAVTSSRVPTPQPHLRIRGRHGGRRRVAVVDRVCHLPYAADPLHHDRVLASVIYGMLPIGDGLPVRSHLIADVT